MNMILSEKRIEEIYRKALREAIDEIELFHGSGADFQEFDEAYMSTGEGRQDYGYGFYLTTSKKTASAYAKGKYIYTVEVPEGRYLDNKSIPKAEAMSIAKKFFNYCITEDEYRKEAYANCQKEFWEYECSTIASSSDGESVWGTIYSILGSDKDTSWFLNRIGYTGLKIYTDGGGDKFINYVIFNPKDIKITGKENCSDASQTT